MRDKRLASVEHVGDEGSRVGRERVIVSRRGARWTVRLDPKPPGGKEISFQLEEAAFDAAQRLARMSDAEIVDDT